MNIVGLYTEWKNVKKYERLQKSGFQLREIIVYSQILARMKRQGKGKKISIKSFQVFIKLKKLFEGYHVP